ncbi:ABC transporter ATP-binding protein [Rhodopirellula sallentina]|uniref:ABC transporter ATP-binding protein n=1 Tax=Rhodopirellula sallentina SM41 TaxID=1263870 RepID=M5UJG1_9BACT|nr:ATP-binding cassette domain-containing protein [Rhodopirellula sallentina]EMI57986.1 ABC transporter ATP-binding protein [Rhodopirellula sallentina SM41]
MVASPHHDPNTQPSAQSAVTIRDATVEFPAGRRASDRVKAIENIDLDIPFGQRLALVGKSGCGKTTLLRVIAGLQSLSTGHCDHHNRGSTSFVFQQPALLPWRRVLGNVRLPIELQHGRRQLSSHESDILTTLKEVDLDDVAERFPYQLSGGMKMRVSIARALVTQPDLLLLDEPFAALDDLLRTQLGELVTQLWRSHGFTLVMVTHNIAEAILLSDRVCVMHEGQIAVTLENPIARAETASDKNGADLIRRTPEFAEFYGVVSDHLKKAGRT